MKQLSTKQTTRMEKKKKKMAALAEISRLNDQDRNHKSLKKSIGSNCVDAEPQPKRLCTDEQEKNTEENFNEIKNVEEVKLGPSGKPVLSGEDLIKLKSLLRQTTKALRNTPRLTLREMGESARISTDVENQVPLFLSDIQHLIMYSQLGHHSPYSPTRWCNLEKFTKIQHTCILIVENVRLADFLDHRKMFPFLDSTFQIQLEILNPKAYEGDIIRDLLLVPLTGTQLRKFTNKYGTIETAVTKSSEIFDVVKNMFPLEKATESDVDIPKTDKFPRTQLLLSGWQMVEENFPLPIKGLMEYKYKGYVLTKDQYKAVSPKSPMFGLDCEMCMTTIGDIELTRVSVVDENCEVFYEQLVKPDNKITDYLTKFSGITPKLMKNVTKRLVDVQADLRRILPSDAILVGQSLGNDLHALKLMHPYVIDSSVIFNITGNRTRKTKLQTLAREFLNERIQEGGGGHCSIEDSIASLKLVQLKLSKSLYFGDAVMSNVELQIRQQPDLGHPNYATSLLKQVTKMEKSALVVGLSDTVSKYQYYTFKDSVDKTEESIRFVPADTNKSAIQTFSTSMPSYSLSIAHVEIPDPTAEIAKKLKKVDKWIKQIFEASDKPSFHIVVFSGWDESGNGCCFINMKTS